MFAILIAITLTMLVAGLLKRGGYLQVPTLFAAVMAGWMLPQIWGLVFRQSAPGNSLNTLLLMTILASLVTYLGWFMATRAKSDPLGGPLPRISDTHLEKAALILTGIALVAFVGLRFAPEEQQVGFVWTGQSTILYFILNLKTASFALSLILLLKKRTPFSLALFAVNILMFIPFVLFMFKRRHLVEVVLIAAYAMLLIKNFAIPRAVVAAGFAIASIGVFATAELRSTTVDEELPDFEKIAEIDFLALSPIYDPQASPEVENAAHLIHTMQITGDYTYGQYTWNRFVFQYVPGQLVGFDVKQQLMTDAWPDEVVYRAVRYEGHPGSTQTGIGTAYMELAFLGLLFFFIPAYFMGFLWRRALAGNYWDKIWYAVGLVPLLHGITHHSAYFFVAFTMFIVALGFVALCLRIDYGARAKNQTRRSRQRRRQFAR